MSANDEFVHVSAGTAGIGGGPHRAYTVSEDYFSNSNGDRAYTEGYIVSSLRQKYPKYHLTVSPAFSVNLVAFAASHDDVVCVPRGGDNESLVERSFLPPARRYNDETGGSFLDKIVFAGYDYVFKGNQFLVYVVEGVNGQYLSSFNYVLVEDLQQDKTSKIAAQAKIDQLLAEAAKWSQDLHGEIYVFDQGYWQKSKDLWQNIQKSNWEDVILEKKKKAAIIEDVVGFFDSEDKYSEFGVPWKRGVIFYGPPGNGKTISTKALMHDLSKRVSPNIESLYMKTFNNYQKPKFDIRQIFLMTRHMTPYLLIFEDIDSLINPIIRNYFLNEVDGLESNHGILMIGSTNHLEQLDPGIAKRPSRFDRKYLFDVPTKEERIQYCEYWRHKLRNNKKVDFPPEMSARVADITDNFSFAYMKEAFVAALLVIVARIDEPRDFRRFRHREDNLDDNILWKELKKQVEALRKEMDEESDTSPSMSGMRPALASNLDARYTPRPMDIRNAMPRDECPNRGMDIYNNGARNRDMYGGAAMPRYF